MNIPRQIERAFRAPPTDYDLGVNITFSRLKRYVSVGAVFENPDTGKIDFYLTPEASQVRGVVGYLNKLAYWIGNVFIVGASEVADSKPSAKSDRFLKPPVRISDRRFRIETAGKAQSTLAWVAGKLLITEGGENFYPIAPMHIVGRYLPRRSPVC